MEYNKLKTNSLYYITRSKVTSECKTNIISFNSFILLYYNLAIMLLIASISSYLQFA